MGELVSVIVLAAAVVPHPPILVPALAAGAAGPMASVLAACDTVVAGLLGEGPQIVVVVGSGERTARYRPQDWGTLAGYGVAVEAPSQHPDTAPGLPLSLTIGRWLLERAGWTGALLVQEVATGWSAPECAQLGLQLAADAGGQAVWLVLGDGSNRRGPRSPGHDDVRAPGFDAAVAQALAAADLQVLLDLDVKLAEELGAAGRPAWQVLAGAASGAGAARIEAAVHVDEAPFGVEYLVADWRLR